MDRDVENLKKWLTNLGLDVNGKISDEELKKLVPPQRRDMWRNIFKHVLPKENVDLIRKSILLHKLKKRRKPLKAIVESEMDLSNALKFEELLTKLNEIKKEIIDAKVNNRKLNIDLQRKCESMKNLIDNIKLKQSSSYVAEQKIEQYDEIDEKLIKMINYCDQFCENPNTNLTKTDYEDSLINCFTKVDDAKESGTMKDGVNVGNELCNSIHTTLSDKSPEILIKTVLDNIAAQISKSKQFINETRDATENNDNETEIDEIIKKFYQLQLKLNSKLPETLIAKENALKHLKEITNQVKNDIISQYKLKNVSFSDEQFVAFLFNVKYALLMVYKSSMDFSKVLGLQENCTLDESTLNSILQETDTINMEIDEKKKIVCEMLKELEDKKSDFGLMELKAVMDNLADAYEKKINNNAKINHVIDSIKGLASCDVNDINTSKIQMTPKSVIVNMWTLSSLQQHTEMLSFITTIAIKFKEFDSIMSDESKYDEVLEKQNLHKSEFDSLIEQLESSISELDITIDNSKNLGDILTLETFQYESSDE